MATIHNPTNFIPTDYTVIAYLDNQRPVYFGQGVEFFAEEVKGWEREMAWALGDNWRTKIGHCCHCGNGRVRWITAVEHLPTGERVVFGCDCTERLNFANQNAFKLAQMKSRADANAKRFKVYNQVQAYLAANVEFAAVVVKMDEPVHAKNSFARDIVSKLNAYGSISDRQRDAVVASLKRDEEFAARRAAEATKVRGNAPEGRVKVTGTVVSIKGVDTAFGYTEKMLVELANGAKVYCTKPSFLRNAVRGDVVSFTATFTVKEDKSFAFGNRPTA